MLFVNRDISVTKGLKNVPAAPQKAHIHYSPHVHYGKARLAMEEGTYDENSGHEYTYRL